MNSFAKEPPPSEGPLLLNWWPFPDVLVPREATVLQKVGPTRQLGEPTPTMGIGLLDRERRADAAEKPAPPANRNRLVAALIGELPLLFTVVLVGVVASDGVSLPSVFATKLVILLRSNRRSLVTDTH